VRGASWVKPPLFKQTLRWITDWGHALSVDRQRHDAERQFASGLRRSIVGIALKQISHVRRGVVIEAGDEGRDASVGLDLRRIEVEFSAPD
jgi:hypothetical protein